MPPKAEITKERILSAAFDIVREEGLDALTARSIAQRLGCSTQPIYSVCGNMEEVNNEAYNMAVDFARNSMRMYDNPANSPALNFAVGFLHFSKNERHLFRTVYLSGHKKYDLRKDKFIGEEISLVLMRHSKRLSSIPEAKLKNIFFKLTVYMIGIGTMINSNTVELPFEEATDMITEMYEALLFKEGISYP